MLTTTLPAIIYVPGSPTLKFARTTQRDGQHPTPSTQGMLTRACGPVKHKTRLSGRWVRPAYSGGFRVAGAPQTRSNAFGGPQPQGRRPWGWLDSRSRQRPKSGKTIPKLRLRLPPGIRLAPVSILEIRQPPYSLHYRPYIPATPGGRGATPFRGDGPATEDAPVPAKPRKESCEPDAQRRSTPRRPTQSPREALFAGRAAPLAAAGRHRTPAPARTSGHASRSCQVLARWRRIGYPHVVHDRPPAWSDRGAATDDRGGCQR
jgi:hypothetical protein